MRLSHPTELVGERPAAPKGQAVPKEGHPEGVADVVAGEPEGGGGLVEGRRS